MTGEDLKAYSPERLQEAIAQVTELAEREGVRVALCGGLALQSYGSTRLTKDVDFVAERHIEALPNLEPLSFGGSQVCAPNGVPVDLIVRNDAVRPLYESALDTAVGRPSIPCLVVQPVYLAAMKLAAGRARDLADFYFLVNENIIDLGTARVIVDKYVGGWYAARDFDTKVEDAKLEAEREKKARRSP
jgi:hypothetical protein